MDGSMFIGTWWSLVPPLLAIALALITKEVYSSLFIGVAMGALLYTGFHPWNAFVALFDIMKSSMNLNILIFDVLLGMIIVLMAKSGGSAAYGRWAGSKIKNKKSAMFATTGLGILIFVDDYFNCLTVGSVMRPVTDKYRVSRAKLAYIIDATAAPVCIIAPISSWAAAVNSYVPADAGITGFQLFLWTIPYNLYALLTLVMVFYMIGTGFDFGLMKKHEQNAARGDLFTSGGEEFDQVKEEEISSNGHVIDLILPVLVLIGTAIGAMIYTGFLGGATDIVTAFSGCDAETSLIFATMITVLFMLVLYLPRKVVTFKGFMDSFVEGFKMMITSFAGLRAHEDGDDFIIGETEEGFIDCAGIESPGLSSAPAIGEMVADILKKKYDLKEKEDFLSTRKGITDVSKFSLEERNAWIRQNPAYGTIVCRCEMVTEGEIIDAIRGPLGARSLDGVKRRTRAGMGRCQAGFCSPRVMEILARELGIPVEEITKSGGNSGIIKGSNKDSFGEDGK